MHIAPKPRGVRQKRMHEIIDEGIELLEMENPRRHALKDITLLNYLLGIAIGIGAITERQCALLITRLSEPEGGRKTTGR